MAKDRGRTNRESKKPKSLERKAKGPKYLRESGTIAVTKIEDRKKIPTGKR